MINRDEWLKMAQEHAICTSSQHKEFMHDGLFSFVDAILERAAKVCEDYAHEALTENDAFTANLLGSKLRNLKGTNK